MNNESFVYMIVSTLRYEKKRISQFHAIAATNEVAKEIMINDIIKCIDIFLQDNPESIINPKINPSTLAECLSKKTHTIIDENNKTAIGEIHSDFSLSVNLPEDSDWKYGIKFRIWKKCHAIENSYEIQIIKLPVCEKSTW